ncbi:hypothetical protein SERLADRAFT_386589, partial [Serpula lacrymans var. lacrymans S7.9]
PHIPEGKTRPLDPEFGIKLGHYHPSTNTPNRRNGAVVSFKLQVQTLARDS